MIGGRGLEVTGYTSDQDRINQSRNTLLFLISLGMLSVVNKNIGIMWTLAINMINT